LAAGTYEARITVTATGAINSPRTIVVTLTVRDDGKGIVYAIDPIVGDLMAVPGGTFIQGSPEDEPCRWPWESQFTHTLSTDLAVMATEVTRGMWATLQEAQPNLPWDPTNFNYSPSPNHPVQNLTWYEAVLFANLLSVERGLTRCYYTDADFTMPITEANYTNGPFFCDFEANGFRLLTEGEWEYACRAGTMGAFYVEESNYTEESCGTESMLGMYPMLETIAWFWGNCSENHSSSEVAMKQPNELGIYDMHGNVEEWCWDWFEAAYPTTDVTDYQGPATGEYRVVRGGAWNYYAQRCRSAERFRFYPNNQSFAWGFRLARRQ